MRVNPGPCAAAVADPNLLATDLADYLVKRGVPFRHAHEAIGRAVALCAQRGCELPQLSLEDYQALSPAFGAGPFRGARPRARPWPPARAIGAPSPQNVAAELERWRSRLA